LIISCFNISLHKIMCLGGDDPRIADLKKKKAKCKKELALRHTTVISSTLMAL